MKCPKCGNELKRSQKNPEYGLCYNCKLKYKWRENVENISSSEPHKPVVQQPKVEEEYSYNQPQESPTKNSKKSKKKEKADTKICRHCKYEIPSSAKVCPYCRKKQKRGKLKWILLGIIVLFIIFAILCSGNTYELSDDARNMSREEFTAACEDVSYDDLARASDKYVGTKVKFTGEIQQVVYDNDEGDSEYLIAVTRDPDLDWWDDNVYVYFDTTDAESKFLEGDIVRFYGEASGEEEYTSVLGESITVPIVTAVYMDMTD